MQKSQFNFTVNAEVGLTEDKNHSGILTQILHDELVVRGETELINRVFWTNPALLDFKNLYHHWEGDVYVYDINKELVVFTSKHIELRVNSNFWINTDATSTDFKSNEVINSFIKILSMLSEYVVVPDDTGVERNGRMLFGNRIIPNSEIQKADDIETSSVVTHQEFKQANLSEGFKSKTVEADLVKSRPLVARPVSKTMRIRDESKLPVRAAKGFRKSYAEIRDVLEDYILEQGDFAVLPVMNADMLIYLKNEGGTYVDPLTEVQVTHENRRFTVCTNDFKIEYDATVRSGHKSIYGQLSSMDEKYASDLHEVAKVLHALNNLYKKYK